MRGREILGGGEAVGLLKEVRQIKSLATSPDSGHVFCVVWVGPWIPDSALLPPQLEMEDSPWHPSTQGGYMAAFEAFVSFLAKADINYT